MGATMRALSLVVALLGLAGCAGGVVPKPYTEQELRDRCERQGGWWHVNDLVGGFCEFQSPGMVGPGLEHSGRLV